MAVLDAAVDEGGRTVDGTGTAEPHLVDVRRTSHAELAESLATGPVSSTRRVLVIDAR